MRCPLLLLLALAGLSACGPDSGALLNNGDSNEGATVGAIGTSGYNDLNLAAGTSTLYEIQVRTANACDPLVGSDAQRRACTARVAPAIPYRAQGMSCSQVGELKRIRLGTLDDLMEDTADFRAGLTLRYVQERVGANTVWFMPLFPNNDQWNIPDPCDDLGSPYAVRDYFHAAGTLSRRCIQAGQDENSATPCWGNGELDAVIAQAHQRGLKVMLDVALNHFGHNYVPYDYAEFTPEADRVARGEDPNPSWNFDSNYEATLLHPELLDTPAKLQALATRVPAHATALAALRLRCPALAGQALVQAYNLWRLAYPFEKARFPCDSQFLEAALPGFYLGGNAFDPSSTLGDNFTNNWRDVKFLFHHEENTAHRWEFVRAREYLFRVLNYWTSRGVDGFRLDHTTDPDSGMGPNEWKYLTSKLDYYAARRGQARPIFLAEEFADQQGMNQVVDVLTEGYLHDMTGREGITKDTGHVEAVVNNMGRFSGHAYVLTALETHDEKRLTDGTGFDVWTGAGFWGIGATTRSTPMLLMGQEFGEPARLDFRKSDYLHSRFVNTNPAADGLIDTYRGMLTARAAQTNRALVAPNFAFLRSRWTGAADPRIFAQVKWSSDANVVFTFHNLWAQSVAQSFFVDEGLASALHLANGTRYRLVDVFAGLPVGACRTGADLKFDLYVSMPATTRMQWLRLEQCP